MAIVNETKDSIDYHFMEIETEYSTKTIVLIS